MSAFQNVNFVNEFAYRTKMNYYHQKRRFAKTEEEKSAAKNKIDTLLCGMEQRGFSVQDYYEVTDLINSLVGLLVFPEQATYKYISPCEKNMQRFFPHLWECVKSASYKNTYDEKGGNSPRNIIRHLRNALSHNRIMIEPKSATIGGERQITAITFNDELKDDKGKWHHFSMTIPVKDLENVVMEICDYLIRLKG